jgi:hypothetical protein
MNKPARPLSYGRCRMTGAAGRSRNPPNRPRKGGWKGRCGNFWKPSNAFGPCWTGRCTAGPTGFGVKKGRKRVIDVPHSHKYGGARKCYIGYGKIRAG